MNKVYYLLILIFMTACGVSKNTTPSNTVLKTDNAYIEKFHEAVRFKHKGQVPQAITSFEACLQMNPNDDAVHYALAQLYLVTKQFAKSATSIKTAVKIDPKNKWYLQEYAYMLFEGKNYTEAAKIFKHLSTLEPTNVDWLFSYAESLVRSNDFDKAVQVFDKLEDEVGINPELSIEKFNLYKKIKQEEKGIKELEEALKVYPKNTQLLGNLIDYYFDLKQDEKAFSYLMLLAENDPNNGNAHLALAQYYDQKGNRSKSYEELSKAFSCSDLNLDMKVKILLSMFDTQVKLDQQMFDLANKLIDFYPLEAKVYAIRGDFNLKNSQDSLALLDFKKALEFDKTKFPIWDQVLLMEYQQQDYISLFQDSKKCIEYFPAQAKVYLLNGIAANQLKKHQEAYDQLVLGEELVTNDNILKAEILAQQADALFALKKFTEGIEKYEKAILLDSKNILYKNNYAYRLGIANTNLDRAEVLILQVLEQSPNESHFIDTYGWILFQKGKYSLALEQFQKALALRKSDKHIIEHAGDALYKLGRIEEALDYWLKAKELGSSNLKLTDKITKKVYYEPVY